MYILNLDVNMMMLLWFVIEVVRYVVIKIMVIVLEFGSSELDEDVNDDFSLRY